MTLVPTKALVLQAKDSGDADRLVTFFTEDQGVIQLFARHVRRARSPMAGTVQPFAFLEITYDNGKSRSLRQCSLLEPFAHMRQDLMAMAYGAVVAEIVVQFWPEGEGEPDLLYQLLAIFRLMQERNPRLVSLAAGWQLLQRAGFGPELSECVHCHNRVELPCHFSSQLGGTVCKECATGEAFLLSEKVYELLLTLLSLDFDNPSHFVIIGSDLMQLEKLFLDYLTCHLDRPLKSLNFIHSIA